MALRVLLPHDLPESALAWATRRRWVEGVTCIVLIGVSAWAGGRSRSAVLVLVLLLLVVQSWKAPRHGRAVAARMGAVLVACALAAYQFGQAVILEGYLGEAARERSQAQIEQSGSLIVGGRPEMAATAGLVRDTPFGFGLGVQPDMHDVAVARNALRTIQYTTDNGYVEKYMFGNGFELHSVLADLWARYSVGGCPRDRGAGDGGVRPRRLGGRQNCLGCCNVRRPDGALGHRVQPVDDIGSGHRARREPSQHLLSTPTRGPARGG